MKKTALLLLLIFITGTSVYSQWEQYYETLPDVAKCKTGVINQTQKQIIVDEINLIRAAHNLKLVEYDDGLDYAANQIALICAANNTLTHTPDASMKCYSEAGAEGGTHTNLYLSGGHPDCVSSIFNWMNDYPHTTLGHRRWIIDPFLKKVALGRADGANNAAMALYCHYPNGDVQDLSDWEDDFVAYPYHYYKTRWVYCSSNDQYNWNYLSFTYVGAKGSAWGGNQNVNYSGATVTITDEAGNAIPILEVIYDNDGYGVPNCLKFRPTELEQEKKYLVEIKGVNYNGMSKDFSYWYMMTDNDYSTPPTEIAQLDNPANNAENVSVVTSFNWNTVENATYYNFQLSKNQNFSDLVYDEENLEFNYYMTEGGALDNSTTYYWRVSTGNPAGVGEWSEVWSFETGAAAPDDIVTLQFPADESVVSDITPLMNWADFAGADKYEIKISPEEDVINADTWDDIFEMTTKSEYQISEGDFELNTQYWWVVRAKVGNTSSDWSDVWSFTVSTTGDISITLLEPENGATKVLITPTLKWEAVESADTYELEVSDNAGMNGGGNIWSKQNISTNQIVVPDNSLNPSRKYFWRVRAIISGSSGPWSEIWDFNTMKDVNTVPTLYTPTENQVHVAQDVTFEWSEIDVADSYNLQVFEGLEMNMSKIRIEENVFTTSFQTDGSVLQDDKTYSWRVQAVDDDFSGDLNWSYLFLFSTGDEIQNFVFDFRQSAITVSIYPNPSRENVNFLLDLDAADKIKMNIYDINGSLVGTVKDGFTTSGSQSIKFNATKLNSGTYYYLLTASDGNTWGKFLIVD